ARFDDGAPGERAFPRHAASCPAHAVERERAQSGSSDTFAPHDNSHKRCRISRSRPAGVRETSEVPCQPRSKTTCGLGCGARSPSSKAGTSYRNRRTDAGEDHEGTPPWLVRVVELARALR